MTEHLTTPHAEAERPRDQARKMSERDDLAALIRKANQDARDADAEAGYRCGFDPDRFVADAILAAGWQPPIGTAPASSERLGQ